MRIHVLPEHVSRVIAAGEVVERPASIVKELMENALDAGAGQVIVELGGGGIQFIRIRDDGEGMEPEDVPLALQRHATSKIDKAEDLFAIRTFGFRGEALPSIASVSKMTLQTRPGQSLAGTKVVCEGGEIRSLSEAGCPPGTEIEVRDIFFNLPVKRRFLKSIRTELHQALNHFLRLSLASPAVSFKFMHDGRTLYDLLKTESALVRVEAILGKEIHDALRPFDFDDEEVSLSGFASLPSLSKKSVEGIYLYVNGRYVRDRMVYKAVSEAYRHLIPGGAFPVAILNLAVPPYAVDVNVHPTKAEVKFRDPERIFRAVFGALRLFHEPGSGDVQPRSETSSRDVPAAWDAWKRSSSPVPSAAQLPLYRGGENAFSVVREASGAPEEKQERGRVRILGQIHGVYLVGEIDEGLLLIDQHAAHERILFEKVKKQVESRSVPVLQFLIPVLLDLTPQESAVLSACFEDFQTMGFEIDQIGEKEYAVRAAPSLIEEKDIKGLIHEILGEMALLKREGRGDELGHSLLIRLACHRAVRARSILRREEMEELVRDLSAYSFSATCPHGRPIFFALTSDELARQFKRK